MSANETDAYEVMQRLDVDYILVRIAHSSSRQSKQQQRQRLTPRQILFGGLTGYASDDINKFLWMVRIGGSVYDWIKEPDYFTKKGAMLGRFCHLCLTGDGGRCRRVPSGSRGIACHAQLPDVQDVLLPVW
jgi:hypothetical protein